MTVTWELLNAYVDNELDADRAAQVAAAIARDPALAARAASLTALRAATRRGTAAGVPARRRRPGRSAAIAAGLAAVVLLAVLTAGPPWPHGPAPLADAVAAHREWLSGEIGPAGGGRIRLAIEAATAGTLPDLSAAGLQLVYLSGDPAKPTGGGILAGYRGPHGCRLGLWIAPRRGAPVPAPAARDSGEVTIRAWTFEGAGYALLSRGMDPHRLDRYAAIVARLVVQGHAATEEQRIAMRDAGAAGRACAA